MNESELRAFLSDLETAAYFYTNKTNEQYKELASKIEVIEWILEQIDLIVDLTITLYG